MSNMAEKQKAGTVTSADFQEKYVTLSEPHSSTNGAGSIGENFDAQLDGSFHSAEDISSAAELDAAKVASVLELVLTFDGTAQLRALETVKALIGHLSESEREQQALQNPLYDWLKTKDRVERFLADCPKPPGAPKFKPHTLAELRAMPAKQWLIEQVLGASDLGMLYGPPGSGKTFIVVDLLMSACTGRQFAMRFDVQRSLNVAYCAGEGVAGLPARFSAAAQFYGVESLPNFTFFDVAPQLYYSNSEHIETIEQFIGEWQERQASGQAQPLDMLVIDTLHSAAVGAEENSAKDMGEVLRLAKLATRKLGCAVLLVHHSNKAGTGERGSSAMRGAMDFMIEVKPLAGKYVMQCEKLKDGQAWKAQTFDLVAIGDTESARVWWDEPGELTSSQGQKAEKLLQELQSRPGVKFTAKALAEAVGGTQSAATNALTRLVDKGEIKRALEDESKPSSNRNAWVYFYESSSEGVS